MRRGDWSEGLRWGLYGCAEAGGWPQVSYRPPFFTSVDRITGKRTTVLMTGLLKGDGSDASAVVTVGPGRESWEGFFRQALYHDLMSAVSALPKGTAASARDSARVAAPASR